MSSESLQSVHKAAHDLIDALVWLELVAGPPRPKSVDDDYGHLLALAISNAYERQAVLTKLFSADIREALAKANECRTVEIFGCYGSSYTELAAKLGAELLNTILAIVNKDKLLNGSEIWPKEYEAKYLDIIDVFSARPNVRIERERILSEIDSEFRRTGQTIERPPYLGLCVDVSECKIERANHQKIVKLSDKQWTLFYYVFRAGIDGVQYTDLEIQVNTTRAGLDILKKRLNTALLDLHLEVAADGRGIWRLRPI